jgi:hypothetical protein
MRDGSGDVSGYCISLADGRSIASTTASSALHLGFDSSLM